MGHFTVVLSCDQVQPGRSSGGTCFTFDTFPPAVIKLPFTEVFPDLISPSCLGSAFGTLSGDCAGCLGFSAWVWNLNSPHNQMTNPSALLLEKTNCCKRLVVRICPGFVYILEHGLVWKFRCSDFGTPQGGFSDKTS